MVNPLPFLPGAPERLAVRGTHDNAVHVRKLSTRKPRSLLRKDRVPHGRPQIIAFETQQQDKNLLICLGIDAAKRLHTPVSKSRPLIIDKEAAVFYGGLFGENPVPDRHSHRVLFLRRHISPVNQWRHPTQLGQPKHAVDGSPLVTARDDQCLLHRWHLRKWCAHNLYLVYLPLPLNLCAAPSVRCLQHLQKRAFPERGKNDNSVIFTLVWRGDQRGLDACHQPNVTRHARAYPLYALIRLRLNQ